MRKFIEKEQLNVGETQIVIFDYYGREKSYTFVMFDGYGSDYGYFRNTLTREIERFYIGNMIKEWDVWVVEGTYKEYSREIYQYKIKKINEYAKKEIRYYTDLLEGNFDEG